MQQEKRMKKNILEGGFYTLEPEEIQAITPELTEINNILSLAKADDEIKKILLHIITLEFFDELESTFYTYFQETGLLKVRD
ncbi:MAG: hypothetical protein KGY67_00365 [Candidatus Thermoplasmatota archaeon]|nr:hypothetical protein [Candidatus Thermoplasmatota archaeon]